MNTSPTFKLLPVAALLAVWAADAQAVNWGAWGGGSNLRSPQFQQAMQNLATQINNQLLNAALGGQNGAPQGGNASGLPATNVQLGNRGTLLSATSGQMLNPATGLPTGPLGGGAGGGGAGGGGGGLPASITLPNDMLWPAFAGVSAAEIATGQVTKVCPDPFFCAVKNPAATFVGNGSDAATQQAWGVWKGAPNATFAMYLKQTPGQPTINFQANNVDAVFSYAEGPVFSGALPVTGTFNYIYLGGVITDVAAGTAGTVNSATLTANFTAGTVQNSLNATIGGTTYVVNTPASNIAANGSMGAGVTCTPACTATTFTGFNGAGGVGAVVTTNINPAIMAQTVFKR